MRSLMMIAVGVLSVCANVALAGPPTVSPVINPNIQPINVPECATGFNKSSVTGNGPSQPGSWTCTTPVISCPKPAGGLGGGLTSPKAIAVANGGERFSYMCSYYALPK